MNADPVVVVRRLIETDLPIAEISARATEGRSVHHGHITAVHIWWARKPLPSCRAVTLAASLLDPEDPHCPQQYLDTASSVLRDVYGKEIASSDLFGLRRGLLQLVSDFASWRHAKEKPFAKGARCLLESAHRSLFPTERSLLADPFCGGGSIPLEGLRLGTSTYASDLNPVAALISKVTLEYVQQFGEELLAAIEESGQSIAGEAEKRLSRFYPSVKGSTTIAFLSYRRIRCEGPRCGADVPLTSKFHLVRKGARSLGLRIHKWKGATPEFEIVEGPLSSFPEPTIRRGAATCLRCGYTTPVERIRAQLSAKAGGASDALLVAVATADGNGNRGFRLPEAVDYRAIEDAAREANRLGGQVSDGLSIFPDEPLPPVGTLGFRVQRYGMLRWRDLFTPRQLLTLSTFADLVRQVRLEDRYPNGFGVALRSCLALVVDRLADHQNTGCSWNPSGSALPHLFTRQAVPIVWDFGEANPFGTSPGGWGGAVNHVVRGLRNAHVSKDRADVGLASASHHPLPTDCAHLLVTDPPYYDAIPYADLSDFFYVWLRRMLSADHPALFATPLAPRDEECIVNPIAGKDRAYYRAVMTRALSEARRITHPRGIGVVIFAHKSTSGWEDLLAAMLDAGWIITASWPIDTENAGRMRARNSAVLASSVHLVCRPREHPDGRLITDTVGDWRDILAALPKRLNEWMPRLAREGIVGADAIFACLGPALELFSQYARVEKVSGEPVELSEYLEHVWAGVSREALAMIFSDADTRGLDEDARLTSMWLWTIASPAVPEESNQVPPATESGSDASESWINGYTLEFDAARKIAQGLGARLEDLPHVVHIDGDQARLLDVVERTKYLFGTPDSGRATKKGLRKNRQGTLFEELDDVVEQQGWSDVSTPSPGLTTLDRIHQSMILFGAGRGEALKRFLVDEGIGRVTQFWKLAQALSALYPTGSDEKRWVDGVLGRKKGLGF